MNDRELRDLARRTLTRKQFEAWDLAERGCSHRQIALMLGIAPETVRDRIQRARRNLVRHVCHHETRGDVPPSTAQPARAENPPSEAAA